jgi:hypothetical protein
MFTKRIALAASVATFALAGCGSSGSSTASTASGGTALTTPTATVGTTPSGSRPQMVEVTGTAAEKAKKAALAKYSGTVEHVTKSGTGYVVHVITSSGEKRVAVSAAFKVTGLAHMPAGGPPNGIAPTSTTPPQGAGTSAATPAVATSS